MIRRAASSLPAAAIWLVLLFVGGGRSVEVASVGSTGPGDRDLLVTGEQINIVASLVVNNVTLEDHILAYVTMAYPCLSMPCENNGVCSVGASGDAFLCSCASGFTGATCAVWLAPCDSSPCANGAACTLSPGGGGGGFACECSEEYFGALCEEEVSCLSSPCGGGATCVLAGSGSAFTCVCPVGATGTTCKKIDECASSPCQNGGACTDGASAFVCSCAAGFTGDECESDVDECGSSPCQNGGACEDSVSSFFCSCLSGYTGAMCESEIDGCASSPCLHGGVCDNSVSSFACSCVSGYTGTVCESDIDECASSPCQNGGACIDLVGSFLCDCPAGTSGSRCETDFDECSSSPCAHGGVCEDLVSSFLCSCASGYTGTVCESDVDECASSPCLNGGVCDHFVDRYLCSCLSGYTGTLCESDVDECASLPCQNGGECLDTIDGFTCSCVSGYTGTLCESEIDECASSPCQNGGQCLDGLGQAVCECGGTGFVGSTCNEPDVCVSSPCQNGGECVNQFPAGLVCDCQQTGYTGLRCETEIDECASSPCVNEGTCVDGVLGYSCLCLPAFNGTNCERTPVYPRVFSSAANNNTWASDVVVLGSYAYLVGTAEGPIGGVTGNGDLDVLIVKVEIATGADVWTRLIGSEHQDEAFGAVGVDGDRLYVVGLTYGSLAGASAVRAQSKPLIMEVDTSDGSVVWYNETGSADGDDRYVAIAHAPTSNSDTLTVVGWSTSSTFIGEPITPNGGFNPLHTLGTFLVSFSLSGVAGSSSSLFAPSTSSSYVKGTSVSYSASLELIVLAGDAFGTFDGTPMFIQRSFVVFLEPSTLVAASVIFPLPFTEFTTVTDTACGSNGACYLSGATLSSYGTPSTDQFILNRGGDAEFISRVSRGPGTSVHISTYYNGGTPSRDIYLSLAVSGPLLFATVELYSIITLCQYIHIGVAAPPLWVPIPFSGTALNGPVPNAIDPYLLPVNTPPLPVNLVVIRNGTQSDSRALVMVAASTARDPLGLTKVPPHNSAFLNIVTIDNVALL